MKRQRQTVTHLPVDQLVAHPGNVRNDLGPLDELAGSIREHGLLHPIVVTEHAVHEDRYVVLDGHRRLGASLKLGLSTVPVIVRHGVEHRDQIVLMLVADIHRRPLDAIERAEAYGALRAQGLTLAEVARQVGTGVSNVSKYLTLLELDDETREEVRRGRIASSQAIHIVREVRQEQRQEKGHRTLGRPKGKNKPGYFSGAHPLASLVRRECNHVARPKVGLVGCGPCWELVIRRDAGQKDAQLPPTDDHYAVDPTAVQAVLDGEHHLAVETNPAEKAEITRRWHAAGRSLADLERLTGINPNRYFHATENGALSA